MKEQPGRALVDVLVRAARGQAAARPARQRRAPAARAGGDGVSPERRRRADGPRHEPRAAPARRRAHVPGARARGRRRGRAVLARAADAGVRAGALRRGRGALRQARAAAAGARARGRADASSSRPSSSSSGSRSGSTCSRAAGMRIRASGRCAPRSSGATTCSTSEEQRLFRASQRLRRRLHVRGRRSRLRRRTRTRCSLCSTRASLRRRDADDGPRYWMLETIREYARRAARRHQARERSCGRATRRGCSSSYAHWARRLRRHDEQTRSRASHRSATTSLVRSSGRWTAAHPSVAHELVEGCWVLVLTAASRRRRRLHADRSAAAATSRRRERGLRLVPRGILRAVGHTGDPLRGIELKERALAMLDTLGDEPIPAVPANQGGDGRDDLKDARPARTRAGASRRHARCPTSDRTGESSRQRSRRRTRTLREGIVEFPLQGNSRSGRGALRGIAARLARRSRQSTKRGLGVMIGGRLAARQAAC